MAGYILLQRALRRERVFRDRSNPFDSFSDTEFRMRYRLSKNCTNNLINDIRIHIDPPTHRSNAASAEQQVLIFLRFLATGQFYNTVGDLHGFSSSTVCRIIRRLSNTIASLHDEYIKMPQTQEETDRAKRTFFDIAGFPGVVGAIDCTHIRLVFNVSPLTAGIYVNRHHWYSLNVQVVCDAHCRITNIVARWPGAVHDSRIWNNSRICADFEHGLIQGYLLGDGGYPCLHTLLTPLLRVNTPSEGRYNRAHILTRSTVERLFGQWKRRFPALKYGLRIKLENIPHIIVAAAVLHNIAINNGDQPFLDDENDDDVQDINDHVYQGNQNRGNMFRRRLIENIFT